MWPCLQCRDTQSDGIIIIIIVIIIIIILLFSNFYLCLLYCTCAHLNGFSYFAICQISGSEEEDEDLFSWEEYLKKCHAKAVPKETFKHVSLI